MMTKEELMARLKHETKVFQKPEIERAFEEIDRADFVSEDYKVEAYEDYALPIGEGQTISQPTTVAFMLELLDVAPGDKVLDVGSGSGYTTALLSKLAGDEGEVYGTEVQPSLVETGRANLKKYSLNNAEIFPAAKSVGYLEHAPYDRILVSAAAEEMPQGLVDQLSPGGSMVIPVGGVITQVNKNREGKLSVKEFPGFAFVPLIS